MKALKTPGLNRRRAVGHVRALEAMVRDLDLEQEETII